MAVTVSRFGDEFGLIEHQLRLQLNAPQCVIKEMQNITLKPNLASFSAFVRSMGNPNIVDVFIELTQYGLETHDVINSGVRVPPKKGLRFCTSKLNLPPNQDEYIIAHCVVALGKVYNNMDPIEAIDTDNYKSTEDLTIANLPEGYDSMRVSGNDEFIVFKPNQINTVHIFKLKGGDNISSKPLNCLECDNCHKNLAVCWCVNDQMKLCQQCDEKIHKVSEVLKKHERKPLGEALPLYQPCPEHPDNKVQYYCPTCHLPLCMECKVKGSHSHKDTQKHKLIPIADMYERASVQMNAPNKIRLARERAVTQAIIEAEETLQALQNNLKNVISEIQRIADAAILEAKTIAGGRIIETKSSLCELQRKYNDLRNQKKLLVDYFQNGEPVPFLQTLHRTELLDKDIETSVDLQKTTGIKADLGVYGQLNISTPKQKEVPEAEGVVDRNLQPSASSGTRSTWSATPATVRTRKTITNDDLDYKSVKFTTLDKMAERKLRRYSEKGLELTFPPFEGSEILTDPEIARKLYLSFPFKALPETHLMFSTSADGRNVKKMHQLIDGKGITVLLCRVGQHVFGGFAASKWNNESTPFGENSSSFLFSIDNNAFIPARNINENSIFLMGSPDSISFGGEDLVIAGNFDRCASELEHTFGIGLEPGSDGSQKFLAGAPRFRADCVEVWGFFSPAN